MAEIGNVTVRVDAVITDEQYREAMGAVRAANERMDLLESENAKLRELVRWMYDRMDESCAVQYPYAPAPISYDRLMQARARVRELGVEVGK